MMASKFRWVLLSQVIFSLFFLDLKAQNITYKISTSSVSFVSNAPLEVIKATSTKSNGIIVPQKMIFAFSVPVKSFDGFNSTLQREHFNEKYLESDAFPNATFSGKFIEDYDFTKDGVYQVRAKGELTIHGVKHDKLIKGTIEVSGNKIILTASFDVSLSDYNINVPKVVKEKIAPDIAISVQAEFTK